jgi:hypothetical protein
MGVNDEKSDYRLRCDERVDEIIRRRFDGCVTGSLFEGTRHAMPSWFSPPPTGRQLHLVESRASKRVSDNA